MTVLFPASLTYSRSTAVRRPGFDNLPPRQHRYLVPAGGVILLDVAAGDSFEVIDPEGDQAFHLTSFAANGEWDPEMLEAGNPAALRILSGAGIHASLNTQLSAALRQRAIRPEKIVSAFGGLGPSALQATPAKNPGMNPRVALARPIATIVRPTPPASAS